MGEIQVRDNQPLLLDAGADEAAALVEELEQLQAEHRALEVRLQELAQIRYPTPEEEAEEHRLKKVKLHKKEEMSRLGQRVQIHS